MVHLQELHEDYSERGLVVLGFNSADDAKIAVDLMRQKGVTYPNVLDSSKRAREVSFRDYRGSGVPLNYVIDREGKIAAAWYGWSENDTRAEKVLEKLDVM